VSDNLRCSFCGKDQAAVRRLFAGPRALICNECVALLAADLTEEDRAGGPPPPGRAPFIGPWKPIPHKITKGR
jgi:ATP-dependent Clp protease ATP-binding subunit ClpX